MIRSSKLINHFIQNALKISNKNNSDSLWASFNENISILKHKLNCIKFKENLFYQLVCLTNT